MDKVYVVVNKDNSLFLFPTLKSVYPAAFGEGSTCYECLGSGTTIEDVREFVYTTRCNVEHGYFSKIFKKVW